ncbi:probable ATP-dependent RNA helicase DDX28 [Hyperolius riggenbachi]|uniref:probable ATP-dependent RNA helicase DDX28 n=1 Tax=Hyperolius riggenbachi TaxID=752182 RepID=UPI0035A3A9A5
MKRSAMLPLLRARWRALAAIGLRLSSSSSAEQLPVVRLSRNTQIWMEKQAELRKAGKIVAPRVGKLLISTRRRELIQAAGETCGRWEQPRLVSQGWKHRESQGDYFNINRIQEHRVWSETEGSFSTLNLDERLVTALESLNLTTPTWVQKAAIPSLLRGRNVLCASETGSGKTLAYLLPIMHNLLTQGNLYPENPHSLVLVPSRELACQVAAVARRLGSQLGVMVRLLGGGRGQKVIQNQLDQTSKVDVLVATPGILLKALKWDKITLAHLHYVVLDEADTLFDQTFSDLVEGILAYTRIASHAREVEKRDEKAQLVIIGATFPKGVGQILGKVMDLGSIYTIKSKRLHFLMPHVQQTFMRLKEADKISELLEVLKKHVANNQETGILVFCNISSTVNWLGYILDNHGIKHSRLHGQMPAVMRLGIFDTFRKNKTSVLVCTDIASRGIDTSKVDTVINYDFPRSLEDYLHRAGRVGRVGSETPGSVISFVAHPWDVELVQKIETAARKRSRLPDMESSIKHPVPTNDLIKENEDEL